MTELQVLWMVALKGLLLLATATLYSMGGRDEFPKAVRRFVAPAVLVGGLALISGCWWVLVSYPLYVGAYCYGYGGVTSTADKVVKRLLAGLFVWGAGLPILVAGYLLGAHLGALLGVLQLLLGVSSSIILGVFSPLKAAEEEFMICMLGLVLVVCYV